MPRVIISGYGLVSAIGGGAWATFTSLLAGRSIADRCDPLPENIEVVDLVRAVGSVSLAQHTATDVAIELAERAAREAMFMAGVGAGIDAIIGSSKGAVHVLSDVANRQVMRSGLRAPQSANGKAAVPLSYESSGRPASLTPGAPADLALAIALGPHGYLAHHLRHRLRLNNVTATVAACASSLTALHQARLRLLHESDAPDHVLVLTSEAALLSVFVHSYDRLGVLPPLTTGGYRGLPLDQKRCGFMLAEMGAAVVLRRVADNASLPRGAVELTDTAIAADAFDLIRSSPQMPGLRRVAGQLLRERRIDLLHPHATGTAEHDPAEMAVYVDTLSRPDNIDVYAVKGAIGHGLGSAGLASLVIACLCAKAQRRPPMPWLKEPIESSLRLNRDRKHGAPILTQAVFSAGFGGHVAGALIETR